MRTARTLGALVAFLFLVFWGGGAGCNCGFGPLGVGGTTCNQAGLLRCTALQDLEQCDGKNWVLKEYCSYFCATTRNGLSCQECPGEGVGQCGRWPFDTLSTCVWNDFAQKLQWEITTNCANLTPTSMCWFGRDGAAGCFEMQGECASDFREYLYSVRCQGDLYYQVCQPSPSPVDAGVIILSWETRQCDSGEACRVGDAGFATCVWIGDAGP